MNERKNRFRLAVLVTALAVLCLAAAAAEAGTLKLPEGLKEIQPETFMGDKALGEVFVPGSRRRSERMLLPTAPFRSSTCLPG